MRPFAPSPFAPVDVLDTIEQALAAAGLDARSGTMHGVTRTIRDALASAGLVHRRAADEGDDAIDVEARVVASAGEAPAADAPRLAAPASAAASTATAPAPASTAPSAPHPAGFSSHVFRSPAGTRAYKLFVPEGFGGEPMPMLVMLHGCMQSPDDFAAGTRMNELAARHGFVVVYPAQSRNANGSNCWNWFKADDQARDGGEPALIAGITRQVAAGHRIDAKRIFVAGLSAGAAMAVILGATYPELYAGVGAHSGLPYRAAHDMPSAFAAMSGQPMSAAMTAATRRRPSSPSPAAAAPPPPTIVVHGDRDATVHPRNGASIVDQAAAADEHVREVERGSRGGRRFTRTVHRDRAGRTAVEEWVVHGAGHAWSGGSAEGSFTDAEGPDASAEMVRFFLALGAPG